MKKNTPSFAGLVTALLLMFATTQTLGQASNIRISVYQFDQFMENEEFRLIEEDGDGTTYVNTNFNPFLFFKLIINKKNLLLKHGRKGADAITSAEFELKYTISKKTYKGVMQVLRSQTVSWNGFYIPDESKDFDSYGIILNGKEIQESMEEIIVKVEIRKKGQTTVLASASRTFNLTYEVAD